MISQKKMVILFVGSAVSLFGLLAIASAHRQGWFARSSVFYAVFENGDGLNVGAPVSISGLKAGSVQDVQLNDENHVLVKLKVQAKYAQHIREDSKAVLARPFIIGERAISITPGTRNRPNLKEGATLPGEESLELTDMLSGGRMSPYFQTFSSLMEQLRIVIEGDGTVNAVRLVDVYKQTYMSLQAIDRMALEVRSIRKDFLMAAETTKMMQNLSAASHQIEPLLVQTGQTLPAITLLSQQMVDLMPRLNKALEETAFTMQAMQRSFILSGGVKQLKKDLEADRSQDREPASKPVP